MLLDLGDGVGAVVLRAPEDLVGHEIDISPVGQDDQRHHVEVLPRQAGPRTMFAAVYPGLAEGSWTLWRTTTEPALVVDVTGGRVTEVDWPA